MRKAMIDSLKPGRRFPEERSIRGIAMNQECVSKFPLYTCIRRSMKKMSLGIDTQCFRIITDNKNCKASCSTNVLYAGEATRRRICSCTGDNSYNESSYRFINGGSQIPFSTKRSSRGGEVRKRKHVVKLVERRVIEYAECADGAILRETLHINIHPVKTWR